MAERWRSQRYLYLGTLILFLSFLYISWMEGQRLHKRRTGLELAFLLVCISIFIGAVLGIWVAYDLDGFRIYLLFT